MSDEAYEPDDAEAAFTQSDTHTFGDVELQPYTPQRAVAAQAIGLRHPNIGEDGMEQFQKTGVYPGALSDVCILLYLCSLVKPEEVRRAMRKPDESLDAAISWGAQHGITNTSSDTFWKAYDKFIAIITEVNASTSKPVGDNVATVAPDPR